MSQTRSAHLVGAVEHLLQALALHASPQLLLFLRLQLLDERPNLRLLRVLACPHLLLLHLQPPRLIRLRAHVSTAHA